MSRGSQDSERRRAQRVMLRIPVQVEGLNTSGTVLSEPAEAVVISRCGALLQSRSDFPSGSIIEVRNQFSKQAEQFRVVWSGRQPTGQFDMGVELLSDRDDFWGLRFPVA